jgi:8-oxo-dGTP pyrophosphatase MutT (NUDIX family)
MKEAVCLVTQNAEGKYLSVSRWNDYSKFGLPGGKVDPGETPMQAAARELKEETGYLAGDLTLIDTRDYNNERVYCYKVILAGTPLSNEELIANGEGIMAWVDFSVLCEGPFGDYNSVVLKEYAEATSSRY